MSTEALGGDPAFDAVLDVEDLADREGLEALCKSIYALFGVGVQVFGADGSLLASVAKQQPICAFIGETIPGRMACRATIDAMREELGASATSHAHACFSGNVYWLEPVEFDGRLISTIVLGPYLPLETQSAPDSLVSEGRVPERGQALRLLGQMPRLAPETAKRVVGHVRTCLDLVFYSGHRALMTSRMHVASVESAYTELQKTAEELRHAVARLEEADRLKSSFLGTVSHELRTPLTSIIGYGEMLLENMAGTLEGEQREFVQTMHDKGVQLLELITSLLDLSKLESGSLIVNHAQVDLVALANDVSRTLGPQAKKAEVALTIEPQGRVPAIVGDEPRLRQVLTNVVDNAVKFTPSGGTVRVELAHVTLEAPRSGASDDDDDDGFALLAPTTGSVELRVRDEGPGIPERERERVFDAFYQVDGSSTREHQGTGLGLAIVRRLVLAHGGRVWIEDNAPRGACFVIRVPLKPSAIQAR